MISMNRKNNRNPGGYYYYFLSETTAAAALRETRRRSAEQAHSNGSVTTGSEHEPLPVRRHTTDTFKGSESQTDVRHTDTGLFQINLKVDDLFCSQHRLIQSKVHFLCLGMDELVRIYQNMVFSLVSQVVELLFLCLWMFETSM